MQDLTGGHDDDSACDLSPELTRPFRGLRLWLPLKVAGFAPFRAALEEKLLLAQDFYERLGRCKGFSLGPKPDLSVVSFRYLPARGDRNAFNRRLAEAVREDGRMLLSTTTIGGRFILRLAVLGYNTHVEDIDLALELLHFSAGEGMRKRKTSHSNKVTVKLNGQTVITTLKNLTCHVQWTLASFERFSITLTGKVGMISRFLAD